MRITLLQSAAVAALIAAAGIASTPAFAGFTATSSGDVVNNTDNGSPGASVQNPPDSFSIPEGTFLTYTADGPNDPQITGGDLGNYGYTLTGNVDSVIGGNVVHYTGTYNIFYNVDGNNTYNPGNGDTSISSGTADLTATFTTGYIASLSGSLTQTQGPTGMYASSFADLGATYGYAPATFTGTYQGGVADPTHGVILDGILRENAAPLPTPLPASATMGLSVLGLAGLLTVVRRKRATL
jgi:hypothetical protein